MNATLKLMGIEKPDTPLSSPNVTHGNGSGMSSPSLTSSLFSSPALSTTSSPDTNAVAAAISKPNAVTSRFSFFRSRSSTTEASSIHSVHSTHSQSSNPGNGSVGSSNVNLPSLVASTFTKEALEAAEVQANLAALDAKEKVLSEEIARGGLSGFTELPRRQTLEEKRSKKSGKSTESAGTIWSLGTHE